MYKGNRDPHLGGANEVCCLLSQNPLISLSLLQFEGARFGTVAPCYWLLPFALSYLPNVAVSLAFQQFFRYRPAGLFLSTSKVTPSRGVLNTLALGEIFTWFSESVSRCGHAGPFLILFPRFLYLISPLQRLCMPAEGISGGGDPAPPLLVPPLSPHTFFLFPAEKRSPPHYAGEFSSTHL